MVVVSVIIIVVVVVKWFLLVNVPVTALAVLYFNMIRYSLK